MLGSSSTLLMILDVLIVILFIYNLLRILQSVGGLPLAIRFIAFAFILSAISWLAKNLHVFTFTGWVADKLISILLISVPIIFQPEFRRALQRFQLLKFPASKSMGSQVIDEVLLAAEWLRKNGYGALIILERDDVIGDVEAGRGTIIDALPKAKLIETIFYPGSPLHDGAVIINQSGKIWAAGYVIPIPEDLNVENSSYSHFGTRHTAALAITRERDVVAIIVSEEKRWIKVAYKGRILDDTFNASPREILKKLLIRDNTSGKNQTSHKKHRFTIRRKKGDQDAAE